MSIRGTSTTETTMRKNATEHGLTDTVERNAAKRSNANKRNTGNAWRSSDAQSRRSERSKNGGNMNG